MDENELKAGEVADTAPQIVDGNGEGTGSPKPDKAQSTAEDGAVNATFTQSQVNDIVRERLARAGKKYLERYGVDSDEELDGLIQKAKSYDELEKTNKDLTEKVVLMEANVNPEKADDIRAWFRGMGKTLDQRELGEALKTHPEWATVANTPAIEVGNPRNTAKEEKSERDYAEQLFGMKFID